MIEYSLLLSNLFTYLHEDKTLFFHMYNIYEHSVLILFGNFLRVHIIIAF